MPAYIGQVFDRKGVYGWVVECGIVVRRGSERTRVNNKMSMLGVE